MEKQNEATLDKEMRFFKNGIQRVMENFDRYIPKWLYYYYCRYPEKIQSDEDAFLFLFARKYVKDACVTLEDCDKDRDSQKESRMRLDAEIFWEQMDKCESCVQWCTKLLRMYTFAKEMEIV